MARAVHRRGRWLPRMVPAARPKGSWWTASQFEALVQSTPHPSPLPREREPIFIAFKAGVRLDISGRVLLSRPIFQRVEGVEPHRFQGRGSTRYFRSRSLAQAPASALLPRGERESNLIAFKGGVRLDISDHGLLPRPLRQPFYPEGKGSRSSSLSRARFDSIFQITVSCPRRCVSPSTQRGKGDDLHRFQGPSSTRYFRSQYLAQAPRSVPSPSGEG